MSCNHVVLETIGQTLLVVFCKSAIKESNGLFAIVIFLQVLLSSVVYFVSFVQLNYKG